MLYKTLRKVLVCRICLGVSLNQITFEYKSFHTDEIQLQKPFSKVSKPKNNIYKSIAKSAKQKSKKLA